MSNLFGYSRAHPVSRCDVPEERGFGAFANLGSKDSVLGRRRHKLNRYNLPMLEKNRKKSFMMETHIDDYHFFREATLRICGSLHVQDALDAFRVYAETCIPMDEVRIAFFDERSSSGIILADSSPGEPSHFTRSARFTQNELQRYRKAMLRDGTTLIINDFEHADEIYRLAHARHKTDVSARSKLRLNLTREGHALGVVTLFSNKKHTYTHQHARLLELLHDPFAMAMSNWRQHLTLTHYQKILKDDCQFYREALEKRAGADIIGADAGLKGVMEMVGKVAGTNSPVMILGETGVGKEVVANAIHNASERHNGPFIKVNCGAIPESLIDSELFGHEKGAFTGATQSHRGRFERASGGTLFLDEVGELPPQAQVRLLRVLQHRTLERVGGTDPIPVDVRIISATHRDLTSMVEEGLFRQDLWFRLDVFPIHIPPLRKRSTDIPDLVHHFVEEKCRELKRHTPWKIPEEAMQRLEEYPWPGNVRELQNIVERELILSSGEALTFDSFLPRAVPHAPETDSQTVVEPLDTVVTRAIEAALKAARGKVQGKGGAAALLGLNANTLRARMQKLGIRFGRHGGDNAPR